PCRSRARGAEGFRNAAVGRSRSRRLAHPPKRQSGKTPALVRNYRPRFRRRCNETAESRGAANPAPGPTGETDGSATPGAGRTGRAAGVFRATRSPTGGSHRAVLSGRVYAGVTSQWEGEDLQSAVWNRPRL